MIKRRTPDARSSTGVASRRQTRDRAADDENLPSSAQPESPAPVASASEALNVGGIQCFRSYPCPCGPATGKGILA